jgi:hypothetical protein
MHLAIKRSPGMAIARVTQFRECARCELTRAAGARRAVVRRCVAEPPRCRGASRIEPRTTAESVTWLERSLRALRLRLAALETQRRALLQLPPALRIDEQRLIEVLRRRIADATAQCVLLGEQLARLKHASPFGESEHAATGHRPDDAPHALGNKQRNQSPAHGQRSRGSRKGN